MLAFTLCPLTASVDQPLVGIVGEGTDTVENAAAKLEQQWRDKQWCNLDRHAKYHGDDIAIGSLDDSQPCELCTREDDREDRKEEEEREEALHPFVKPFLGIWQEVCHKCQW